MRSLAALLVLGVAAGVGPPDHLPASHPGVFTRPPPHIPPSVMILGKADAGPDLSYPDSIILGQVIWHLVFSKALQVILMSSRGWESLSYKTQINALDNSDRIPFSSSKKE